MKINEPSRINSVNPYSKQQDLKHTKTDKAKVKQKDEVQISPEAKELQEAQAAAGNAPVDEARQRKIEELKKAVSTGTYQVDAGKVAEKLWPYLK